MSKAVWLCAGLAGGVLLTLGIQYALREPEDAPRARSHAATPADVERGIAEALAENKRLGATLEALAARANELEAKLEEYRKQAPSTAPEAPSDLPAEASAKAGAPPTDDEIMKGIEAFGASLGAIIRGGGEQAKEDLKDLLARAGKHGVEILVAKFEDDATDIQTRAVLAHALAQSGSPDAIATLTGILADPEAGMLELRLASHGLAFTDAPGIDDALLAVAHRAADTGARANAAFGLARRKKPEGIGLYLKATDEAMANRDPAALQYLSGFMLLGDDALPPLRERLLTYTEPQAALTVMEILKARGDKGAIENLRKLAADEGRPASIRKAAEGALKALEAAPK